MERGEDIEELRALVEAGKLTPVVDRAFPLADAAQAVRYLEEGRARGKVVITMYMPVAAEVRRRAGSY